MAACSGAMRRRKALPVASRMHILGESTFLNKCVDGFCSFWICCFVLLTGMTACDDRSMGADSWGVSMGAEKKEKLASRLARLKGWLVWSDFCLSGGAGISV